MTRLHQQFDDWGYTDDDYGFPDQNLNYDDEGYADDSFYTTPDQSLNYDDEGHADYSFYKSPPTYQESLYEGAGGDLYYGGEYDVGQVAEDNRSYLKRAQDYLFNIAKDLGLSEETLKAINAFAAAAGKGEKGDGKRDSSRTKATRAGAVRANQMTKAREAAGAVIAQSSRAQSGADYLRNQSAAAGRDALENLQNPSGLRGQTIALPGSGALNQLKISSPSKTKVA